jgi:hypothetical protein
VPWVLAPIALTLDGVTAFSFAGHRLPLGFEVPEALLLAAPFLVYGALAFVVYGTRPLAPMLTATALLLGLHAALVAAHTLLFAGLWSLPLFAALRLAHRWSPLTPLLQLVWVPLMALPLAWPTLSPATSFARRPGLAPARRDVLASRGASLASHDRAGLVRDSGTERGGRATVALSSVEAPPDASAGAASVSVTPVLEVDVAPAAVTSASLGEDMRAVLPVLDAPGADRAVTVTDAPVYDLEAEVAVGDRSLPTDALSIDAVVVLTTTATRPAAPAAVTISPGPAAASPADVDTPRVTEPPLPQVVVASLQAPAVLDEMVGAEAATPTVVATPIRALPAPPPEPAALPPAPPVVPVVPVEPPLDVRAVARVFEAYSPLLSRDSAVLVDWARGSETAVVCVATREIARPRMVELAGRLWRALAASGSASALEPVRRLTIHDAAGVAVLTPLDGGMLAAAARRPGAAALLEVLSARAAAGSGPRAEGTVGEANGVSVPREIRLLDAVRVDAPAASVEVLAPADVDAQSVGELTGRLLAALVIDGDDRGLRSLGVDLGAHRLVMHPIHPIGRPPRFVAVVGGAELPGLLGRRAAHAAQALREAS